MGWRPDAVEQGGRLVGPTWAVALRLLAQESDAPLKAMMAVTLFLVIAASALTALSPLILKVIVDSLSASDTLDGPLSFFPMGALVVGYAVVHFLARALGELRTLTAGRADQRLHRRLSLRLFKHVMSLPLRFHLDRRTGALSQALTNGLLGYRILVHHLVTTVLPVMLELGMISAVLIALGHPIFFGIIGVALLSYTLAFVVGAIRLTRPARAISSAHIDANALLTDSVVNCETIKYFCAETSINRRMADAFAQTEAHWNRFFARKASNGVFVATIFALSLGASVYIAAREVQHNSMSLGDFVLVNAYLLQVFKPIEMLGFAFRDIAQGMAFIEKLIDVFRQEPEPTLGTLGAPLSPGSGTLVFDKVSFSYNQGRPILQNVSFVVAASKTVALVGASGSGKSSLIRLLVRFWEPESGCILLDGTPISQVSSSDVRNAIAVVPQDTVLFNESFLYNIAIGRPGSSIEEITEAARLANIHDYIASLADGYKTLVGERGLKLSGGERQRIAIARAALKKPRVFVFDEATSSLDSETEQKILRNLREVTRGTTTLVVAHRLSTTVEADEILVLKKGRIVESGTHSELLKCRGVYSAMWTAQLRSPTTKQALLI